MVVARHPEVVGSPKIDSEFEGVITPGLQHITDELELLLLLIERAIAPVDSKAGAKIEAPVSANKAREEPGGEPFVQVQTRDPGVGGRRCSEVSGQYIDAILEEPEAKVHEHRRRQSVVEARGYAVVADFRCTAER